MCLFFCQNTLVRILFYLLQWINPKFPNHPHLDKLVAGSMAGKRLIMMIFIIIFYYIYGKSQILIYEIPHCALLISHCQVKNSKMIILLVQFCPNGQVFNKDIHCRDGMIIMNNDFCISCSSLSVCIFRSGGCACNISLGCFKIKDSISSTIC